MNRHTLLTLAILSSISFLSIAALHAREPDAVIDIWPAKAPGETSHSTGDALPRRLKENPPATRVTGITRPQMHIYNAPRETSNGAAVLIFPGGAYNYVVTDKEGSEAADWLNGIGITAFVVHYRTKTKPPAAQQDPVLPANSERPLQDGQRAVSLVRNRAAEWNLRANRIGVIGFSAGGQAATLVTTRFDNRSYAAIDDVDAVSCRPDFSMLIYPWQIANRSQDGLIDAVTVTKNTPSTLLIHAHNDRATPMSSILFYTALKKLGIPSELHIYSNGGHGYGMRPVENSDVDTWPQRAADWLKKAPAVK